MRSPEYQLRVTKENTEMYIRKVEHGFRALKDDIKHGSEWTYLHLMNVQDDMRILDKFIEHYHIIRLMRDAEEIEHPNDAPVPQSAEGVGSNPA